MHKTIEWTVRFLKNKDVFKKEITDVAIINNDVIISKKNGIEQIILAEEYLSNSITANRDASRIWVVFELDKNTPAVVTKEWSKISEENVWIIAVDVKNDKKWLIHPASHAKIVEKSQILKSIQSIQDNA